MCYDVGLARNQNEVDSTSFNLIQVDHKKRRWRKEYFFFFSVTDTVIMWGSWGIQIY